MSKHLRYVQRQNLQYFHLPHSWRPQGLSQWSVLRCKIATLGPCVAEAPYGRVCRHRCLSLSISLSPPPSLSPRSLVTSRALSRSLAHSLSLSRARSLSLLHTQQRERERERERGRERERAHLSVNTCMYLHDRQDEHSVKDDATTRSDGFRQRLAVWQNCGYGH